MLTLERKRHLRTVLDDLTLRQPDDLVAAIQKLAEIQLELLEALGPTDHAEALERERQKG